MIVLATTSSDYQAPNSLNIVLTNEPLTTFHPYVIDPVVLTWTACISITYDNVLNKLNCQQKLWF